MKKKLLSFLSLTAIAVLAFAATQGSRRAATTLWSSETATYCTDISIAADKFADAKVGDVLKITVVSANAGDEYQATARVLNADGKQLEEGVNIGGKPDGTEASFILTGDILSQLKSGGMKVGGYGFSSKLITLESGDATASDKSIWVGSVTNSNIDRISLYHFANANNFSGVKVGDVIRVNLDKTSWVEGTSGWIQLQYYKGWSWTQISGDDHDETTVKNKYNGDPVEITINTAELAAELNDVANNHGLIVQVGKETTATSVELVHYYTVTVATGITGGKVEVDKTSAEEGDEVTITTTPDEGYKLASLTVKDADDADVTVTGGKFTMPAKAVTVSATFAQPEDITVAAADITGGDITAALKAATAGKIAKNITINLAKDGAYTISAPIEAAASVAINGADGAKIDASGIEAAMITTPAEDSDWSENTFTVKDVTIDLGTNGLYASAGKNYLYTDFTIENSIIKSSAANVLNFVKGGVAKTLTINKSTIYAPTATSDSFYKSQSGQKGTEAPGVTVQTFVITNSTMYNYAVGKNFFTHRQSNQTWLAYTIKNSIFLDCGKSGQVVKGINQGQSGTNPTWDIDGNIFNFTTGGVITDTSTAEDTGDADEPVKNSVAGVIAFTDAANGDFNGTFALAEGATEPTTKPGDPRWTINYTATGISNIAVDGADDNAPIYNLAGQKVDKNYKGVIIRNGKKYFNK